MPYQYFSKAKGNSFVFVTFVCLSDGVTTFEKWLVGLRPPALYFLSGCYTIATIARIQQHPEIFSFTVTSAGVSNQPEEE